MIAPHNGRREMLAQIGALALRARLRRCRTARAFEDKEGGWTLVTPAGMAMRVTGAAAVHAWESLQGQGRAVCELAPELAALFPRIPLEQITQDLLTFTSHLLAGEFLEVVSIAPAQRTGADRSAAAAGAGGNGRRASDHSAE